MKIKFRMSDLHYLEPEETCISRLIQQFGMLGENFRYCIIHKQPLAYIYLGEEFF